MARGRGMATTTAVRVDTRPGDPGSIVPVAGRRRLNRLYHRVHGKVRSGHHHHQHGRRKTSKNDGMASFDSIGFRGCKNESFELNVEKKHGLQKTRLDDGLFETTTTTTTTNFYPDFTVLAPPPPLPKVPNHCEMRPTRARVRRLLCAVKTTGCARQRNSPGTGISFFFITHGVGVRRICTNALIGLYACYSKNLRTGYEVVTGCYAVTVNTRVIHTFATALLSEFSAWVGEY